MSDTLSTGWDRPTTEKTEPLPMCAYHLTVTERLSTHHSNQIARQAPCCTRLSLSRHGD